MTAHEIHALSGAYAVDALDDLERARFETHLAACAECQAEVASLQDATLLLSSLTEATPPAALRAEILDQIRTVRPLPPVVARIEAKRPRRWNSLVAAAAVLGIVGGGFTVWQQTHEPTSQSPQVGAEQIMQAADVTTSTKNLGKSGTVKVYRSASLGKVALQTTNLPAAPSGKVYELWLRQADGDMVKAGFLNEGGNQQVPLEGDANSANAAGISIEPAGGSKSPTILYTMVPFEQAT